MGSESVTLVGPAGSGMSARVSAAAVETIVSVSRASRYREAGGILIGRYDPAGHVAEVLEATPAPGGSAAGRSWFKRGDRGLAELLDERWTWGWHYVGEWHSHPGAAPVPSWRDKASMFRIARDPSYQCERPLLAILGGWAAADWSLSMNLFSRHGCISLGMLRTSLLRERDCRCD